MSQESARSRPDHVQTPVSPARRETRRSSLEVTFTQFGMNALLGLWRVLGMRFRLEGAEYRCTVS